MKSDGWFVRDLPLPAVLVQLIMGHRWKHPSDDAIQRAIPFLADPVDFLNVDAMRRKDFGSLPDDLGWALLYRVYRGSKDPNPRDSTWLDVEKAVTIAVCRYAGDDVAIALDYRNDAEQPRVVASHWVPNEDRGHHTEWHEVAPTFGEFARMVGLVT